MILSIRRLDLIEKKRGCAFLRDDCVSGKKGQLGKLGRRGTADQSTAVGGKKGVAMLSQAPNPLSKGVDDGAGLSNRAGGQNLFGEFLGRNPR